METRANDKDHILSIKQIFLNSKFYKVIETILSKFKPNFTNHHHFRDLKKRSNKERNYNHGGRMTK